MRFETTQEAIEWLREDVSQECGDAMVAHFWVAYDKGYDVDGCAKYALSIHEHLDHGHGTEKDTRLDEFPFKTDEQAVERIKATAQNSANGPAPVDVIERVMLDEYWKYRDWGCNIYYSMRESEKSAESRLQEMFPMSLEEALNILCSEIPDPEIEMEAERQIREAAASGAPLRQVLGPAIAAAKMTIFLKNVFGGLMD
jgi:hypothetical protein